MLKTRAEKRSAILQSRIELARSEARNFIEDLAVRIKRDDAPSLPLDAIILSLRRGLCDCAAALENMKAE
jgi:hypothetical protein